MKHLARLVPFLLLLAAAPAVRAENVANCFEVREMVKSHESRYYVDAVSRCSQRYEAVYVKVAFLDAGGRHLDEGVWAIYLCRPGRAEVHEFGIPKGARGFASVVVRLITTDVEEGLSLKKRTTASAEPASPCTPLKSAGGRIGDPGEQAPVCALE